IRVTPRVAWARQPPDGFQFWRSSRRTLRARTASLLSTFTPIVAADNTDPRGHARAAGTVIPSAGLQNPAWIAATPLPLVRVGLRWRRGAIAMREGGS